MLQNRGKPCATSLHQSIVLIATVVSSRVNLKHGAAAPGEFPPQQERQPEPGTQAAESSWRAVLNPFTAGGGTSSSMSTAAGCTPGG